MIEFLIGRILWFLRSRIPASLDEQTRGSERNRRAVLTGSAATLARVVQISTSLVTVPLTLKYLGNERFGLWMAISSMIGMANFADFGIGNGVLNYVAKAFGEDDLDGVRRAVSSGFAVLAIISLALLGLMYSMARFIPWASVFRVTSSQARTEAGPALIVFATCFALNIPFGVVQRLQLGLQQGFRTNIWQISGSVMGLIGVILGMYWRVPLPVLILALAGAPVLATGLNSLHYFTLGRPDLRPRWQFVSRETISQIARLGGLFFILQMVGAFAYSADSFIIARTLGAVQVPEYAIPQRMFSLISMLIVIMVGPLWPAYGEAIARGDIGWVRHTLKLSLMLAFAIAGTSSAILLLIAPRTILWWIGPRIHPPFMLLLGLSAWCVIESCGGAVGVFLNGVGLIKFQVVIASLFGVACLSGKVILIHFFGVTGVPWATVITYSLVIALPLLLYLPYALRKLHTDRNKCELSRQLST